MPLIPLRRKKRRRRMTYLRTGRRFEEQDEPRGVGDPGFSPANNRTLVGFQSGRNRQAHRSAGIHLITESPRLPTTRKQAGLRMHVAMLAELAFVLRTTENLGSTKIGKEIASAGHAMVSG